MATATPRSDRSRELRQTSSGAIRICQLITPSKIAGAERSTASLCEHLQAAGHQVQVGCKRGSRLIEVLRSVGVDAQPLAISGKLNPLAALRAARFARNMQAEVIHTHLSTAAWHGSLAARLTGLPSIAHVRALNSPHWYRLATRVIAVSHAVKEHLVARGMAAEKIDVVYNGVDPARYYLPCSRSEARTRLGLPDEGLLVGVIAHLTAKKGHAVFLDAFARIASQHPQATAVFVGDGEQRDVLARRRPGWGLHRGCGSRVFMPTCCRTMRRSIWSCCRRSRAKDCRGRCSKQACSADPRSAHG